MLKQTQIHADTGICGRDRGYTPDQASNNPARAPRLRFYRLQQYIAHEDSDDHITG